MTGRQYVGTQVSKDVLRQFEDHFPMSGVKSWFIRRCFEVAAELAEEGELGPPRESVDLVVERVSQEL